MDARYALPPNKWPAWTTAVNFSCSATIRELPSYRLADLGQERRRFGDGADVWAIERERELRRQRWLNRPRTMTETMRALADTFGPPPPPRPLVEKPPGRDFGAPRRRRPW